MNEYRVLMVAGTLQRYHRVHGKLPETLADVHQDLEKFEHDLVKPDHEYSWRTESSPHALLVVVELQVKGGKKYRASEPLGPVREFPDATQ